MKAIDLTGKRFGHLVVMCKAGYRYKGSLVWTCKCDCGNIMDVNSNHLRTGHTKSCGCYKIERIKVANVKHGECNTRLYKIWSHMIGRCNDSNSKDSKWYKEKGIVVYKEWHDYLIFKEWALENGYDPNAKFGECTLDRIDGNKGYSPENCRWVNAKIQARNRSTNKMIEYSGKVQSLAAWCEELNLSYSVVQSRLYKHWSVEKAFNTPIMHRR